MPAYRFAGQTFNQLGVTSNGYLVAGVAGGQDVTSMPQTLPDPARPTRVIPTFYWTKPFDGTAAPGIFVAVLTDGVSSWIVIEWRVNVFGTTSQRVFQTWIGINGTEDITFAYNPAALPAAPPAGFGLTVGAETLRRASRRNPDRADPAGDAAEPRPCAWTSTPGAPGGTLTYSFSRSEGSRPAPAGCERP